MKLDPALLRLQQRMQRRLLLTALGSASIMLVAAAAVSSAWPGWARLSVLLLLGAALAAWTEHWWHRLQGKTLARHLNRRWPVLEDSAQLLVGDETISSPLAARQAKRVVLALERQQIPGQLPRGARRSMLKLLALALAVLLVPKLGTLSTQRDGLGVAHLTGLVLEVSPPAYTGQEAQRLSTAAATVVEGSRLRWELAFAGAVDRVWLAFDDAPNVQATTLGPGRFAVEERISSTRVYTVSWQAAGQDFSTEPALIQVQRDQPPSINVQVPEFSPQEVRDPASDQPTFVVEVSDDFGLGEGVILATVAKGEGEGVKFRDIELAFDGEAAVPVPTGMRAAVRFRRVWDLEALGMEPGDELYFRARVTDNREPEANSAQTPVLMLRWLAERGRRTLALQGLAVDILPEYFRSQRQIIIDTEKLVADRSRISVGEGIGRSRSLARDQKTLRIRYGQYLGEEYESEIGLPSAADIELDDSHAGESFAEHLAHAQGPHGGPGHNHGDDPTATGASGGGTTIGGLPGFMADFVHAHDSAEQATLFDEKTRETLKAALAEMWQSELNLHLSRPVQALPYQYQALTLLKQVQQANRIYVRRAGFEPPALDEGKRLTGDPDESADSRLAWRMDDESTRTRLRLGELLTTLAAAQPSPEELAWLQAQAIDEADRTTVRLAAATFEAGSCVDCLKQLQGVIWRALGSVSPPANVRRSGPQGRFAESYFAPLAVEPVADPAAGSDTP
ncbi:MAG: hypothetical protein AAF736_08390 [Pseudomonadota bacterium]